MQLMFEFAWSRPFCEACAETGSFPCCPTFLANLLLTVAPNLPAEGCWVGLVTTAEMLQLYAKR